MPIRFLLAFALITPAAAAAEPIDRAAVRRGLVLTTAGPGGATLSRLEPGVGVTLAAGERADPQAAAEVGGTLTWTGTINVLQAAPYRFDATVQGRVTVTVGGVTVFAADEAAAKQVVGREVELPAGIQPFTATLTRTRPAARLELLWSGPGFRPEPVPYYFFGHLPAARPAGFLEGVQRDRGRFLVEEHACVKCHAAGDAAALAERVGPDLSKIGERTNAAWLDAWLKDPHALRPDTTMPKLFADDAAGSEERYSVVVYLGGLGKPKPAGEVGLREMARSIGQGQKVYLTAGCAACHGEQVTTGETAPRPLGEEEEPRKPAPPEEGVYGLGTGSPRARYALGHPGSKYTADALEAYLADPLKTNPHSRMPASNLGGPDTRDLARFLARFTSEKFSDVLRDAPGEEKRSAKAWADYGKRVYAAKGCANCHAIDSEPPQLVAAPPLAALAAEPAAGCLGESPDPAKLPVYSLDAGEKAAVGVFLKSLAAGPHAASPVYAARADFKRFGCLSCHNRDGEGGLEDGLADRMKSLETAANADDVAPPRLTQTGHKLRASWLRAVLLNGGRARPWMGLRMPQYGKANVGHLVADLPKTEGAVADDAPGAADFTPDAVAAGRTLAGKNGMGCVACHDISGVSGGGTRGPDLARTRDRLRLEWYTRWMHQPQRLAPGTKMPTNFLNGTSLVPGVLGGDADKQIAALWSYFALGPGLPLPAGMEPPPGLTVAVGDKPTILRTFLPDDAGTRPIAVGFPGGVNVAFDTASGRVSYAWAGNFLDAAPVWDGRGGRPAKLLGPKFYAGPAGFPWATGGATGETPPDFRTRLTDPEFGHQLPNDGYAGPRRVRFQGYTVGPDGVPAFTTELRNSGGEAELTVTETVTPLPVRTAPGFRRTFTVKPAGGGVTWLYVDAADGATVEGRRAVVAAGGRATVYDLVEPPDGVAWEVKPGNGLLLKVPGRPAGPIALDTWGVARNEPALIDGLRP